MYLRAIHADHHLPTLRAFIRENPLGILTTALDTPSFPLLQSSHIPWILDVADDASETELGTLRGHIARANPQAKAMTEHVAASSSPNTPHTLARDVMLLFTGPTHYISPKFYTTTKPATGKVVPTWNYAAVQAYGRATVYLDPKSPATDAFLAKQIADLTNHAETNVMGYEKPWQVGDAPEKYVDVLKKAIIGVEVEITSLAGKWKMSQEMGKGDREGVAEGLEGVGGEAGEVAGLVRQRGEGVERRREEEERRKAEGEGKA